jgi:8-oxo-dGTP diphosphatase
MAHYCVLCGTELGVRIIEGREVEACSNDDFVLWHDPKVSTAVVIEFDGGVVLGRRAIEPRLGFWCLPGGFVNDDEDPWEAAARECMEEICTEVELVRLIGVYHIAKESAPSMIGIAYQARLAEGSLPSPGPEMLEVGVFDLDSLPVLAFPSHYKVLAEHQGAVPPTGLGDEWGPTFQGKPAATEPRIAFAKAPHEKQPSRAREPSRQQRRS